MNCNKCGAELAPESRFCSACGTPVSGEVYQPEMADAEVPAQTPVQETADSFAKEISESTIQDIQEPIREPVQKAAETIMQPQQVPVQQPANTYNTVDVASGTAPIVKETPKVAYASKPKKLGFFRGFLSVLCCLLIFIITFTTLSVLTFRISISPANIADMVTSNEIQGYIGQITVDVYGVDNKKIEFDVIELYNDGTMKEKTEEVLTGMSNYVLYGDYPKALDADDIVDFVRENEDVIEKSIGVKLDREDYNAIRKDFRDVEDKFELITEDINQNPLVVVVRILCSPWLIGTLFVFVVLSVLLLMKTRKWRADNFAWIGVTFAFVSVLFMGMGVFGKIIAQNAVTSDATERALVNMFTNNVMGLMLRNGGLLLAGSILLVVIYAIIRAVRKPKII